MNVIVYNNQTVLVTLMIKYVSQVNSITKLLKCLMVVIVPGGHMVDNYSSRNRL